jgi:hypothetical protein
MKTPPFDPASLSPLSYGPGLALGLFLIVGLPAEPPSGDGGSRAAPPPVNPVPATLRAGADAPTAAPAWLRRMRARRALTAGARP